MCKMFVFVLIKKKAIINRKISMNIQLVIIVGTHRCSQETLLCEVKN